MNPFRQDVLADAGLAEDQDVDEPVCGLALGGLSGEAIDLAHGVGLQDGAPAAVFGLGPAQQCARSSDECLGGASVCGEDSDHRACNEPVRPDASRQVIGDGAGALRGRVEQQDFIVAVGVLSASVALAQRRRDDIRDAAAGDIAVDPQPQQRELRLGTRRGDAGVLPGAPRTRRDRGIGGANGGRRRCTIKVVKPMVTASPSCSGTRLFAASLLSRTKVPFGVPRSSTKT